MSENKSILKFLRKFFLTPKMVDDIKFEFVKIDLSTEFLDAFDFKVNVVLPNPGNSYIVQVFDEMIQKMISESFDFLGQNFSYSITIIVDGQELFPKTYNFIKKETLKKIIRRCNERFDEIGISVNLDENDKEKELIMNCKLSWDEFPYDSEDENINFQMTVELSNFNFGGKKVIPNPEKVDIVAGTLWSILTDRDWFVPVIEEIIYEEISPDTKINQTSDVYVQLFIRVNKLNGEIVNQNDTFFKIQKDDFIEVS